MAIRKSLGRTSGAKVSGKKKDKVASQTQKKQDGQYGDSRETLKRSDIQHIVQVIEPNGRA